MRYRMKPSRITALALLLVVGGMKGTGGGDKAAMPKARGKKKA